MDPIPHTFTDGVRETASGEQINENFAAVKAAIDLLQADLAAGWDADDLSASLASILGVTADGVARRGKSIVAAQESRASSAYGVLPTPDRVQRIVLPTDGLLAIAAHATWAESVSFAARAAIFVGGNQLKGMTSVSSVPVVQEAQHGNTATQDQPLFTTPGGLVGHDATGGWADVATGQVLGSIQDATDDSRIGGVCYVFAAAGTYDISLQFKASSGSVTVKNRKLWVWSLGF